MNNINKVINSAAGEVVKGHCIASVCKNVKSYSDEIQTKVINSGGGHFNHSCTSICIFTPSLPITNNSCFGSVLVCDG